MEKLVSKLENELIETKDKLAKRNKELEEVTEREENLIVEIQRREDKIRKVRNELAQVRVLQASADRLVFSSIHDVGHRTIRDMMEEDDSIQEYLDREDRFTPRPEVPMVDNTVEWFLENYKDPANGVPYEGEYIYVYGGPYHAEEVLPEHFPDADEVDIENAVEEIESDGLIRLT